MAVEVGDKLTLIGGGAVVDWDKVSGHKFAVGNTVSTFEDGAIFGQWVMPFETTFEAGLALCGVKVGVNFSNEVTLPILNADDSEVGHITIATDGSYTVTLASDVVIPAFGAITIMQPSPLDPGGANVSITIVGTITG